MFNYSYTSFVRYYKNKSTDFIPLKPNSNSGTNYKS